MAKKVFRFVYIVIIAIALGVMLILVVTLFRTPRLDRAWEENSRILPSVTVGTSTVEVKNMRDWRYGRGTVISKNYKDETFDLSKIEKAYLLFNPFGEWEGVAHSFFVFEFSDGKSVSVSIEARREEGETYNVVKGILNEYEMWYAFGSPEDFMGARAIYSDEELYKYPLDISTTTMRGLFVDLSNTAHRLESKPEFYNTVTSNCTNLLADAANRVNPGSVPWSFARIFTGYADDELYKLKLIPHDKPFEEVYKESRVDELVRNSM